MRGRWLAEGAHSPLRLQRHKRQLGGVQPSAVVSLHLPDTECPIRQRLHCSAAVAGEVKGRAEQPGPEVVSPTLRSRRPRPFFRGEVALPPLLRRSSAAGCRRGSAAAPRAVGEPAGGQHGRRAAVVHTGGEREETPSGWSQCVQRDIHRPQQKARQHTAPDRPSASISKSGSGWARACPSAPAALM